MVAKSGKKKRKLNSKTVRQILLIRKKFPEAFTAEGIVSCAVEPVLVNPIILIKAVRIFYSFFSYGNVLFRFCVYIQGIEKLLEFFLLI